MTSQCGDDAFEDELDGVITLTTAEKDAALSDAIERIKREEAAAMMAEQGQTRMDSLGRSPDTVFDSDGTPSPNRKLPPYKRPPSKFSEPPRQEESPPPGIDPASLKRMEEQLREEREEREQIEQEEAAKRGEEASAGSASHQSGGGGGALQELVSRWDQERKGYKKVVASLTERVEELQRLQGDGEALTTQCDWNDVAAHHAAQLHWWLTEKEGYVQNVAALESQVNFLTRRVTEGDAVVVDQTAALRRLQRRVDIQESNFLTIQKAYQDTLQFNQEITAERDLAQADAKWQALENERLKRTIEELEGKQRKDTLKQSMQLSSDASVVGD